MPGRFDTPDKKAVRENWNTPILRYIHETYGMRYRYLGLPGVELIDVKLWKDMIEEVIAFEVRAEIDDERKHIRELRKNLELLGITGKAFYGSIEHVVLMREDLDNSPYKQDKLITLYNLDFCDEITSSTNDIEGRKCLRFEAIRQILMDQHECYDQNGQGIFILLITARNQTSAKFMKSYLFNEDDLNASTVNFVKSSNEKRPIPEDVRSLKATHSWALKAFVFDTIRSYFSTPHLTSLVFPMVKYTGMPVDHKTESPMMHWMFLCKFENPELPKPKLFPRNFLCKSSLSVSGRTISMSKGPGEIYPSIIDPVRILKEYESYFFS